jgi:hypothetical protein
MSAALPIHLGWLGNSLLQRSAEYGQKTRLTFGDINTISDDNKRLIFQGFVVDRIDLVEPSPNPTVTGESLSPQALERQRKHLTKLLQRWEHLALTHPGNPYGDGSKHEAFYRVIATNGLRSQGLNMVYPSTIQASRIRSKTFLWAKLYENLTGPSTLTSLAQRLSKEEMGLLDQYGTAVLRATAERALVVTEGGWLGLGTKTAKPGDLMCLVRGGRVPFVLRERGDGTYGYVGDCYVEGLMKGEYFDAGRGRARREDVRTFELC